MAYDQIEKFHLDRRLQSFLTVVVAVCYTAMAVIVWPDVLSSTLLALAGIIFIAPIWSMDVVIHRDGIQMYRVNRLCWSDITAARKRSVLSLAYLHITRAKGLNWWLPLYFTGDRDMLTAIAEKAPAGNPVKVFANGR